MTMLGKWTAIIVGLAIYLNLGWALGTYVHNNVKYGVADSVFAKILAGPNSFLVSPNISISKSDRDLKELQIASMLAWPGLIVVLFGSWIAYGIYYGIYYLLWLMFAGGIAKIFGYG